MKKFLLLLAVAILAQSVRADSQWLTSVPEAQARAKKENKLVLLDFTGSDWCSACKILDKNVLSQPVFVQYAAKNLVLVQVDFPLAKEQSAALKKANDDLQTKYKVDGYPTLIALKPDGTVVWSQIGYDGSPPSSIIAELDKARR